MTSYDLNNALSVLIHKERKVTNEILALINVALDQRAYLELGYSSMFDWLMKGFGYSSSAAYRRIEAARLIKAVPEASAKLSDGKVNLSTLCKAQTMIRQHEKNSGSKVDSQAKAELVQKIENKTVQETELIMFDKFPEIAVDIATERRTAINSEETRLHITLSKQTCDDLMRAKEVLSHKFPEARDADIIAYALEMLLNKLDPLRKITAAAAVVASPKTKSTDRDCNTAPRANPSSKSATKRITFKSANGACTFKDPISGRVCGSKYQAQLEHIIPRALGGRDHPSNLTVLCRQHNLLMAEKVFGKKIINTYRTT